MFNTLGLSGGWFIKKKTNTVAELGYHSNKNIVNEKIDTLWFDDQRHFATFKIVEGKTELERKLKTIGKDLLNDNVTYSEFLEKYKKFGYKKIDIVLNDQKVFSGIGNYLKAEVLYQAKISPHSIIKNIPDNKLKELLDAIKDRIQVSYKLGGASVKHYSDLQENNGHFQDYFRVYGKKKDPNGYDVVSERVSKPNNPLSQKTYWCPKIQVEY